MGDPIGTLTYDDTGLPLCINLCIFDFRGDCTAKSVPCKHAYTTCLVTGLRDTPTQHAYAKLAYANATPAQAIKSSTT
jgi:hypothetical protein